MRPAARAAVVGGLAAAIAAVLVLAILETVWPGSPPRHSLASRSVTAPVTSEHAPTAHEPGALAAASQTVVAPAALPAPPAVTSTTVPAPQPASVSKPSPPTTAPAPPPPSVALSFPAPGGVYGAARWNQGCGASALCGTASDPTGVANVLVGILQVSSGLYWNGHSFASASLALLPADGTTFWRYPVAMPPGGSYRAFVGATNRFGVTTSFAELSTVPFTIETVPPPAPVLTATPPSNTTATSAWFTFSDAAPAPVGFSCSLDGGSAMPCAGQATYPVVRPGGHCFAVQATDAAGNLSAPARYCWTVQEPPGEPSGVSQG